MALSVTGSIYRWRPILSALTNLVYVSTPELVLILCFHYWWLKLPRQWTGIRLTGFHKCHRQVSQALQLPSGAHSVSSHRKGIIGIVAGDGLVEASNSSVPTISWNWLMIVIKGGFYFVIGKIPIVVFNDNSPPQKD